MSLQTDRTEILRLHDEWWEANRTMDHSRMRRCFAEGDSYYQFNLNGHPYFGIDEKVQLWREFGARAMTIPEVGPDEHLRVEIAGDMAWLACENVIRVEVADEQDLPRMTREPFRV